MATAIGQSAERAERLSGALDVARRQIAAAELDIVFYPDIGMEALTYFLAFARLAPVQCVTWGHPVTTGIPALDYFVSSELLEPDGAEAHYAERLVRLPRLPACSPGRRGRPRGMTATTWALARGVCTSVPNRSSSSTRISTMSSARSSSATATAGSC